MSSSIDAFPFRTVPVTIVTLFFEFKQWSIENKNSFPSVIFLSKFSLLITDNIRSSIKVCF